MDPTATSEAPGPEGLAAVVFDFDGVILESADIKTEAFIELFSHLEPDQLARVREHHLQNLGVSRFRKFEWIYRNLLGCDLPDAESKALGDRFTEIVLRRVLECPMVRGAERALAELCDRYPLFVASGTPQEELDYVVDRRGLRRYFREVWGSPRTKVEILRDIAGRNRLRPAQVLFVGDGTTDAEAARTVGAHFLARVTPPLADHWAATGARQIDDLTALAELVASW